MNSLWFKWKSLRLPWRNMFLVGEYLCPPPSALHAHRSVSLTRHVLGQDLAGNTFWEFKATKNADRLRRIVKFDPRTHYADVKVTRESELSWKIAHLPPQQARIIPLTIKRIK